MKKSPNKILADMSAVRRKGIKYYQKNYFWPVPEDEYNYFINLMHDTYTSLILDLNENHSLNIALVDYKFIVNSLEGIFHYHYLKEYAKNNNISVLHGKESYEYMNPNWEVLSRYYSEIKSPFNKFERIFRRLIKNIVFNKHLSLSKLFIGFFSKKNVVGIGSYDRLKREFVESKNIFCDHVDWYDLLPDRKIKKSSNINLRWKLDIVTNVIDKFISRLKKEETLFVSNMEFDKLRSAWISRISDIAILYENLIEHPKPKLLLVTEMAKPHSRLFTVSFQDMCDVYCFHHGNDSGLTIYDIGHRSERAHCNKLVVPTNGIANEFYKNYSSDPIGKRIGTKFISVNSSFYTNLLSKLNNYKESQSQNTIMLVGTPANPNRYVHEQGQFFYIKVDLELRLIKILKENGYRIIYKAHPDRLDEIEGIFGDLVDEYNISLFEDVWQNADILLFTDTASTTFGFSLATNKKIVLLNNSFDNRNTSVEALLKKRVRFVNISLHDDLRMKFDTDALLSALSKSDECIDNSFVNKILN